MTILRLLFSAPFALALTALLLLAGISVAVGLMIGRVLALARDDDLDDLDTADRNVERWSELRGPIGGGTGYEVGYPCDCSEYVHATRETVVFCKAMREGD
jgi:hypothetical protein